MEKAGKIYLVGFGPGSREHMSARAVEVIKNSDVIIGYTTYISLVKDLIKDKQVVRKGMTEEIDRCIEAYEQARKGKTVAIVSSGDIGIYGMAGPTYEVLFQSGWTPDSKISLEVVPGTTALSACAALVGAPLTHDFCSISLSDLLTPWPTIACRLESAGKGDFVIALYNPKSGRRTKQILEAQNILLHYRRANTPVAIVKSAYRRKQRIEYTTLDKMSECEIGMLSTVLIGNSSTFMQHQLMVTPRGYANKYQNLTGNILSGEKAGHSLSMGLDSWYECVIFYSNQYPKKSFTELADYFLCSESKIYSALEQADNLKNNKLILQVQGITSSESIINFIKTNLIKPFYDSEQSLEFIIKNKSVELCAQVRPESLLINGDIISVNTPQFKMQVQCHKIKKIWFIKEENKQFTFTNSEGDHLFTAMIK